MPYEKVVTFSYVSGEQNDVVHVESTLPSFDHDAVLVNSDMIHFKTSF